MQSASLELDGDAEIISYEEYHPYGTTAFQAKNASINAVAKRYRYTGKERDEESGLYYHGARYYIPWLCRWVSVDPINNENYNLAKGYGLEKNLERQFLELTASPYEYCFDNPVRFNDLNGEQVNFLKNNENLGNPVYNTKDYDRMRERVEKKLRATGLGILNRGNIDYALKRVDVLNASEKYLASYAFLRFLEGKSGYDVYSYSMLEGAENVAFSNANRKSTNKVLNKLKYELRSDSKYKKDGTYSIILDDTQIYVQGGAAYVPISSDLLYTAGSFAVQIKGIFSITVKDGKTSTYGGLFYTFTDIYDFNNSYPPFTDAKILNSLKAYGAANYGIRAYYSRQVYIENGDVKNMTEYTDVKEQSFRDNVNKPSGPVYHMDNPKNDIKTKQLEHDFTKKYLIK